MVLYNLERENDQRNYENSELDQSVSLLLVGFYNINVCKLGYTYSFIIPSSLLFLSHHIHNYFVKCFMSETL